MRDPRPSPRDRIDAWHSGLAAAAMTSSLALAPGESHAAILETTGAVAVGDFDADDTPELVVGSPEAYCGKGLIYVLMPETPEVVIWTRDSTGILGDAACGDTFGAALAAGDFDGDGYDDLAIGVAGAEDAGPTDSGSVHVLYGSSTGLTDAGDQIWHQDTSGIEGVAEATDFFGDTLESGDFNCDGYADLAIGVPRETVITSSSDEGAVHVLYGSSSGLSNLDDVWYQGVGGVDDVSEVNDRFGASLARANLDGDDESGVGCDDLVIGAPYESIGSVAGAGWIYTIDGGAAGLSTTGDQAIHQESTDVVDTAQEYDFFGFRIGSTRIDDDEYDDLFVDVPGDACASSTPGVGRHVFFGSAGGITTTGNAIACETFGCQVPHEDTLVCPDQPSPVYASSDPEHIGLGAGHDVVWAGAGSDVVIARFGHDVVFAGPDADTIDGGPGRDILIGGSGDDIFIIDASCEVAAGDVVDGGAGNDKVKSHLSQSELVGLGVTFVQIEAFELISEDGVGDVSCVEGISDDGPFVTPRVSLGWPALPSPASTYSTTPDELVLACANSSGDPVDVSLRFDLYVRGIRIPFEPTEFAISANATSNYTLELDEFIPSAINPSEVDPALLVLPTSASLRVRAHLTVDGHSAGWAIGPTLYGHLDDEGETLVLYRDAALRSYYNDGDLAGMRVLEFVWGEWKRSDRWEERRESQVDELCSGGRVRRVDVGRGSERCTGLRHDDRLLRVDHRVHRQRVRSGRSRGLSHRAGGAGPRCPRRDHPTGARGRHHDEPRGRWVHHLRDAVRQRTPREGLHGLDDRGGAAAGGVGQLQCQRRSHGATGVPGLPRRGGPAESRSGRHARGAVDQQLRVGGLHEPRRGRADVRGGGRVPFAARRSRLDPPGSE